MASFNNMRGPNVSEFIANLNAIPSTREVSPGENFNLEDDLAMFTNTQFFDFDLGHDADFQPPNFDFDHHHHHHHRGAEAPAAPASSPIQEASKAMDFHGTFSH